MLLPAVRFREHPAECGPSPAPAPSRGPVAWGLGPSWALRAMENNCLPTVTGSPSSDSSVVRSREPAAVGWRPYSCCLELAQTCPLRVTAPTTVLAVRTLFPAASLTAVKTQALPLFCSRLRYLLVCLW